MRLNHLQTVSQLCICCTECRPNEALLGPCKYLTTLGIHRYWVIKPLCRRRWNKTLTHIFHTVAHVIIFFLATHPRRFRVILSDVYPREKWLNTMINVFELDDNEATYTTATCLHHSMWRHINSNRRTSASSEYLIANSIFFTLWPELRFWINVQWRVNNEHSICSQWEHVCKMNGKKKWMQSWCGESRDAAMGNSFKGKILLSIVQVLVQSMCILQPHDLH